MASTTARYALGFIGAGQMASALAGGLARSGAVRAEDMVASDRSEPQLERFRALGAAATRRNADVWRSARAVVVSVKPHVVPAVLAEAREAAAPGAGPLVVSIAAGVGLAALEAALPPGARVVRVMPNTPCLVGAAASAFCLGSHATREDAAEVSRLFSAVGRAVEVPERSMDAVTGLSGSGPAYVFLFIEALADGGVRMGLPRAVAAELAAQTVFGAAKMALEGGRHPGQLKDAVASPGGTTIAAIHALEARAFRGVVMDAVKAAADRSAQLSKL